MGKIIDKIKALFPRRDNKNKASKRRGLFTPAQHRKLAKKADQKHKSKGIKEALDGPAFLLAIFMLDDFVIDKLPDSAKAKLIPFIDNILDNM